MLFRSITPEGKRAAKKATKLLNGADMAMAPLTEQECERLYDTLRPLRADADGFAPS